VAYRNDIDDVAALLRCVKEKKKKKKKKNRFDRVFFFSRNHGAQHYAVWNLTERGYDYAKVKSITRTFVSLCRSLVSPFSSTRLCVRLVGLITMRRRFYCCCKFCSVR
jgi:hypothetical protein